MPMFTGYVQGMSDLLSPILVVMENEVDAFWCFVGFMEMVVRKLKAQFMVLCVPDGHGHPLHVTMNAIFCHIHGNT